MMHIVRILAIVAGIVGALPAGATSWTWSSSNLSAAEGNPYAAGTGPCTSGSWSQGCEATMTSTQGSTTLNTKVRAYSTLTAATSSNLLTTPGTTTGLWRPADLDLFAGSGWGVDNKNPNDSTEGSSPEHATDNNQVVDILVFELPALAAGFAWDIDSFKLGWARERAATGTGFQGNQADLSMYFGGNNLGANYNFSTACFTTTAGCTADLSNAANWTPITHNNVQEGVTTGANSFGTGKYLVVSGKLGDGDDHFKFDTLTAKKVPLPGTLALLGLGLFGLAAVRRRAMPA